ncbi:MAG TPA: two-component regulator propeller domain-containing protein, partial [Prolixibacteraceae bacterium]|nr:two-component regulator propeller domain-containing protein [Prolixibacteraceae bacterium]
MNRKMLLLLCSLMCFQMLWAQNRNNLHTISRREGLSNGAVNAIVKDAEGYMWFGTWNGLNRYDGSTMVTYIPGSSNNAIHNHVVREIYPSRNGQLWMLTNKGIALYDNENDCFYPFFNDEYGQINYENDISLCHSDQYGTKVAVYGRGIFRFDSIARHFVAIPFDASSQKASEKVKRLHAIANQFYCLTDSNLLFRLAENSLNPLIQLPID